MTITPDELVKREVFYCVSYLIHELAQNEKYSEELMPILIQDDFESAATDEGWEQYEDEFGVNCYRNKDGSTYAASDWRELCEAHDIDPHQNEAYEHWIVSGWLADKLEANGEMVLRDFLGLTIWGRACTGQMISMDYVIGKICADLNGKEAA